MAVPSLRQLDVRWSHEPGIPVASLRGDVDASAAHDIGGLVVVVSEVPRLALDLDGVTFVDVCGLDLLESLVCRENVEVRGMSVAVVRLLERTDALVDDWPAMRAALAAERV
jgi:anti-anti-sigma factor